MNLLNPFRPRQNYYIIECLPLGMRALSVQLVDNRLIFTNFFDVYRKDDLADFFRALKLKKDSNILFLHDHTVAATFGGSVKLEKNNFRTPLTENDVQMFLSAATRQFFNRFREEAKRRLAVPEVEVILANNRFLNLNINGKPVINPLGQTARFAELEIEQTYLARSFWDAIREHTEMQTNVFHIEGVSAVRDTLTLLYPERRIMLAAVLPKITRLYACGGKNRYFGAVSFPKMQDRGEVGLGSDDLFELVGARFRIEKPATLEFLTNYVAGNISKHLSHVLEKIILPFRERLGSEISRFLKRENLCVVVSDAPFLPLGAKIQHQEAVHINFESLASRLNLEIEKTHRFRREAFSPVFLSGLVAYFRRTGDNYLSGLARERMRWMQPENSA